MPGHRVAQEASRLGGGEVLVRGRADRAQPPGHDHVPEPGQRLEQVRLAGVAGHQRRDLGVQVLDRVVEDGDPVPVQPAHQRVMVSEPAGQGHRQVGHLPGGPHPGLRQVRHHLPRRSPLISASIIAVDDMPVTSDRPGSSLIPAVSSVFCSRWISEVRAWTVFIRYRPRSRTSFRSGAGM